MRKSQKQKLIDDLRTVAQMYFNRDTQLDKSSGLCQAVARISNGGRTPYWELSSIYLIPGGYLCPPGRCWKQRAMFALVFAEYLEGEQP